MEELGNLATGFEVDGGQLRHQLYVWLEKETEVLKVICNYGMTKEQVALEGKMKYLKSFEFDFIILSKVIIQSKF